MNLSQYEASPDAALGTPADDRFQGGDRLIVMLGEVLDHMIMIERVTMMRMQGRGSTAHEHGSRHLGLHQCRLCEQPFPVGRRGPFSHAVREGDGILLESRGAR